VKVTVFRSLVTALVLLSACRAASEPPADRPTTATSRPPLVSDNALVTVISPDQIPAIDEPRFVAPTRATWLADREPVVSLEIGGDARAYPVQIMTWHEIANNQVGGVPVTVSYCPLCNSAIAYDRRVGGQVLDFGTSGKLYKSALVMYDRQTESLWSHFEGLAIQGPLTGTRLELVPVQLLSFGQWRETYPDGRVLSRDTGTDRPYGENPYAFYDTRDTPHLEFFDSAVDDRLPPLARVVGVMIGDEAVAFPYRELAGPHGAGVAQETIGDQRVTVFWEAGVASALDEVDIAQGRDVGTSGVFLPIADGRRLGFEVAGGSIVDRETGSRWSVVGQAIGGPLEGARLEPVPHIDAFWFAWWAYHTDTGVFGLED
jgi:hypothetical protein